MESVQQMNVRILGDLKARGDAELKKLGFSPSQAVRRMYEMITGTPAERERMAAALKLESELSEFQKEAQRKIAKGEELRQRIIDFDRAHGIMPGTIPSYKSNAELHEAYAEALMERMEERCCA